LSGWRADVIGNHALRWLEGKAKVLADPKFGVRVEIDPIS
jgi:hypothetical protein